jgi:hypothetical protein
MSNLQIGDTIECHDKNDLIDTMEILQKEGIYCDWMFEKEGKKGYWLIVKGSEKA